MEKSRKNAENAKQESSTTIFRKDSKSKKIKTPDEWREEILKLYENPSDSNPVACHKVVLEEKKISPWEKIKEWFSKFC